MPTPVSVSGFSQRQSAALPFNEACFLVKIIFILLIAPQIFEVFFLIIKWFAVFLFMQVGCGVRTVFPCWEHFEVQLRLYVSGECSLEVFWLEKDSSLCFSHSFSLPHPMLLINLIHPSHAGLLSCRFAPMLDAPNRSSMLSLFQSHPRMIDFAVNSSC